MSVTFHIAADSMEEFAMLESEGAPEVNVSNTNWHRITRSLGLDVDCSGRNSAAEWEMVCRDALAWGGGIHDEYVRTRVADLLEVAVAANRLGRQVSWA